MNSPKNLSFVEKIFSVRNEGFRKIICILGLKIKLRTPRLVYRELNSRLEAQSRDLAELSARMEQQSRFFNSELTELRTRLEERTHGFDRRMNEMRAKLMYRINEYCPDEKRALALKDWYFESTGEILNLENPQTYNEKMQWMKLYDSKPVKSRLADKYAVREWVKEKIGEEYLVPLHGVWDKFDDIDFDKLPDKFVLKCNHGSGYVVIVSDKSQLDRSSMRKKINAWMNEDFSFTNGFELHYSAIPRKIIAEQFLTNNDNDLTTYEFWCFDGKVRFIEFLTAQKVSNQAAVHDKPEEFTMAIYDTNWRKQDFVYSYPASSETAPKPDNLDLMIKLAESLAENFSHVRVDLYDVNGKIYFSEMTFTTCSGVCYWNPKEADLKVGRMLRLPE